ncbi:hypothetical protein KIN20_006056 [Parelaphostrongylus tenuis]|uniref:Serine aminopeptidase S33 domain-containing protein n=1 Tax=Parelaphostrongylus tenuis TaxID=148309 RepID=A0AAD5MTK3_PARTN|nr:hypothetical protein KIN20_006056 [Parelaphostrongylus tenuis]
MIGIVGSLFLLCQSVTFVFVLAFLVFPLLVFSFPTVMVKMFFLNFRRMPLTDYMNVSANNVRSIGRAFYLRGEEGDIGVWHVLPSSLSSVYREKGVHPCDDEMETLLSIEKYPIVLYLHGNSFDRTISHRVEMYNVLSALGYQVVAFDYRGYGDSDGYPSERGLVNDSHVVYDYVKSLCVKNAIIIWGHSMGTGVATKLAMDLSIDGRPPLGLILESPFNNLRDVIMNHPFSLTVRWMPETMVRNLIVQPLQKVGLTMETDQRIVNVSCPILIIHAGDDPVIPVKLARKLRDAALAASRDVEYVEFENERNYKHKFIYTAPELQKIVPEFVDHCREMLKASF